MNHKLKNQLHTAFAPPPPIEKDTFLKQLHYPKSNKLDVFITQVGYIRKRLWILSILLIVYIFIELCSLKPTDLPIGKLSAMLPLLSLLGLGELQKSMSYNMVELEMSCKHHFGEVTLIRLTVISTFDILLLLLLSFSTNKMGHGGFITLSYLAVPFLASSYLSLWIMNRFASRDTLYICGGATAFVSFVTSLISNDHPILYTQAFNLVWMAVFLTITILLTLEIIKFMKKTEDLSWNLSLTA